MIHTAEIESSNLRSPLEWDDALGALTVLFRGGARWEYWGVTQAEFDAVAHPGEIDDFSSGRAFARLIKGQKQARKLA